MVPSNTASAVMERRQINDEIEETYISATQASANCLTAVSQGKGNLHALYRDFYQYFYHLFDLTRDTKEIVDKESKMCDEMNIWFINQTNVISLSQSKITALILEGIEYFRKYKKILSAGGIISLPSGKR
jgi:hypothetical protein